jgi:hypothetical protein
MTWVTTSTSAASPPARSTLYALFAHDGANNYAAAAVVTYSTARSTPDTAAPGPVTP